MQMHVSRHSYSTFPFHNPHHHLVKYFVYILVTRQIKGVILKILNGSNSLF